jgi:hypothetical protein
MSCGGNYKIADVLPLTPVQQRLLIHASTAQYSGDVYAVLRSRSRMLTGTGSAYEQRVSDWRTGTAANRQHATSGQSTCTATDFAREGIRSGAGSPLGQTACRMAVATARPRPITAGNVSAALSDARL